MNNTLYTSGVEIECFLSDNDGNPVNIDAQPKFKEDLAGYLAKQNLPEFSREPSSDTIEFKTHPMGDDIQTPLKAIYESQTIAHEHNLNILFAGVNPQSSFQTFDLVDTPYFSQLTREDFLGSISCNTASIHVNLFLPETLSELMFPLIYGLQEWVVPITTIMQSSPIYNGKFTNYMAGRQLLWDLIHPGRTGLVPEGLSSWSDYDMYRNHLLRDGVVNKITKIWWDIRPKPIDGGYLIEVRFADSSTFDVTMDYVTIVSDIYHALIERLIKGDSIDLFSSRLCLAQTRENVFRHGRDAKIMLGLNKDSLNLTEWASLDLAAISETASARFLCALQARTQAEQLLAM